MLNILFARAFQARLSQNAPVLVVTVDPGFSLSSLRPSVDTEQLEELAKVARTSEEGSRQVVLAALGPRPGRGDVEDMRGAYVADNEVREPSEWVRSSEGLEAQEKLWVRRKD